MLPESQETRKEEKNMRKGSFKNKSQKPKLHPIGIYKYKKKTALGFSACFVFGSVVSSWFLTSRHKTQKVLNILQMGHYLATLKYTV